MPTFGFLFLLIAIGLIAAQLISGKITGRSWDGEPFAIRDQEPFKYWLAVALELLGLACAMYIIYRDAPHGTH